MSQTIWWCEEHRTNSDTNLRCHATHHPLFNDDLDGECRIGEHRLVSPTALVVERDENGQWPEWATDKPDFAMGLSRQGACLVLDALAASQGEGEL